MEERNCNECKWAETKTPEEACDLWISGCKNDNFPEMLRGELIYTEMWPEHMAVICMYFERMDAAKG
jgi:hypothetical protein